MEKFNYDYILEAVELFKDENPNKEKILQFSLVIINQCLIELRNMYLNVLDHTREREIIFFDDSFEDFCLHKNLHDFLDMKLEIVPREKRDLFTTLNFLVTFDEILINFNSYPLADDIEEERILLIKKLNYMISKKTNFY